MASWDTIGESVERLVPLELHMRFYRVIESTPALLAAHLRRATELEEEIALVIADREGLDVDTDPRPRVVVAVFGAVMRVTERIWSARDDASLAALRDLTSSYLDQVEPALTGNWRGRPGSGRAEQPGPADPTRSTHRNVIRVTGIHARPSRSPSVSSPVTSFDTSPQLNVWRALPPWPWCS